MKKHVYKAGKLTGVVVLGNFQDGKYRDPNADFEVKASDLEKIGFSQIRVRDVIKVTHGHKWGWDYRHIHELHQHPTDPNQSYATGFGYRAGTGLGGCEIGADRKEWVLERVKPNTAYRLLEYYQQNWAHPEVPLQLDPRTIEVE